MHRDNCLRLQQFAGVRGFARRHGEVVAYGQHDNLRRVKVSNNSHVAEYVRIARVVKLDSIGKFEHIAARLAAINNLIAILNSAGMHGVHHGDFHIRDGLRATFVHGRNLLYALFLQPSAQLKYSDGYRIKLLPHFNGIGNMVAVPVGAQHYVSFLNILFILRTLWILRNKRVDVEGLPFRRLDTKCSVAKPRELDSFQIHDKLLKVVCELAF